MKLLKIYSLLLVVCYFLPETLAGTVAAIGAIPHRSRLTPAQRRALEGYRKNVQEFVHKNCGTVTGNGIRRNKFKRESSSDNSMSDSADSDAGSGGMESGGMESGADSTSTKDSMMTTLKGLIKKIPQINFYSSIPNAVGVVGQGFSVLEKISTALGTPLPYFIGCVPVVAFGIALVFIPDLTTLNLPGFYPSGAGEHDPLSAFPPLPDLDGLPDVDLSLTPENIPPRIIPPAGSSSTQDEAAFLSNQLPAITTTEDADSPTNPLSFQAPRRRIHTPARNNNANHNHVRFQQTGMQEMPTNQLPSQHNLRYDLTHLTYKQPRVVHQSGA